MTLSQLSSIVSMNLKLMLRDIKLNICAFCQNNITKNKTINLPCGCNFCSKVCFERTMKVMFSKDKDFKLGKLIQK